jgi:hypothetical protein
MRRDARMLYSSAPSCARRPRGAVRDLGRPVRTRPASSYSASATTWTIQEDTRVSRATPGGGHGRTAESLTFVKSLLETQTQSVVHMRETKRGDAARVGARLVRWC